MPWAESVISSWLLGWRGAVSGPGCFLFHSDKREGMVFGAKVCLSFPPLTLLPGHSAGKHLSASFLAPAVGWKAAMHARITDQAEAIMQERSICLGEEILGPWVSSQSWLTVVLTKQPQMYLGKCLNPDHGRLQVCSLSLLDLANLLRKVRE